MTLGDGFSSFSVTLTVCSSGLDGSVVGLEKRCQWRLTEFPHEDTGAPRSCRSEAELTDEQRMSVLRSADLGPGNYTGWAWRLKAGWGTG